MTVENFLGLDTAQQTLGFSHGTWDGEELKLVNVHRFDPPETKSDFQLNDIVVRHVRDSECWPPTAAALESPAYGYRSGMVSIGTIHGVLCQNLLDAKVPFVYSTPNKLKYFAAGPAKKKPWPKKKIMDQVRSVFGKLPQGGNWDSNMSDATVLMLMAFCAHLTSWTPGNFYPTPFDQKWARHVFESRAKSKGRMGGIFHRRNEFYWRP